MSNSLRLSLIFAIVLSATPAHAQPAARREILIGIEYAPPGMAKAFAELGVPAVKHYPDSITWGSMQRSKDAAIDFSQMDRFVREYQDAGFTELVLVLKAASPWASKVHLDLKALLPGAGDRPLANFCPKPEHMPLFEAWVKAVVERYDHDGKVDMPGLKRPVRYFELGSEFSTFEPTPTPDYLTMLQHTCKSARAASKQVNVLHAAFLITTVFRDHPSASQYEQAFRAVNKRIMHKSLADMRAVLDRTDLYDAVNFHALADPCEIEDVVAWLRYEMKQRRISKPIIISDTMPSPLIAWGPANTAVGRPESLGIVVPPVAEADRPRVAAYFQKLLDDDKDALEWTHAFAAADMVKKIVVAAEQGVALINTSFMEDLAPFKAKIMRAGAGTSAWGGMAEVRMNFLTQNRTVQELRPSFYAIQQVQRHIKGYESVERVRLPDQRIRLYKFARRGSPLWIAWLEPGKVILPGETEPSATFSLKIADRLSMERMIDRGGQVKVEREVVSLAEGSAAIKVTTRPIFLRQGQ